MSAAIQPPGSVPGFPGPHRGTGRRLYLALAIAAAAALLYAISSWRPPGPRGLPGVAPEERAALLARTLDELRRSCGATRPAALEDHCRELASFAASFEECRGDCEALVQPLITPTPTR